METTWPVERKLCARDGRRPADRGVAWRAAGRRPPGMQKRSVSGINQGLCMEGWANPRPLLRAWSLGSDLKPGAAILVERGAEG